MCEQDEIERLRRLDIRLARLLGWRVEEYTFQDMHLKWRTEYRLGKNKDRLHLVEPLDLVRAKEDWLAALAATEEFARNRPSDEAGCLYYSAATERFELPEPARPLEAQQMSPHYGAPGGVVPRVAGERIDPA